VEAYKDILLDAITISLVYCVSLTVFPGLLLQLKFFNLNEPWKSVFVVGFYSTCDCIGRFIPSFILSPSASTLRYLAALRILFVLMVILALPICKIPYL
jgi:cadmium resistance protein CadD (predicted permease)